MEKSLQPGRRVPVHALHLGDRINTVGYDGEILSAVPLAVRNGQNGVAVLFRYCVAVLIGFTPEEEAAFLQKISTRIVGRLSVAEEEHAVVEIDAGAQDQICA